MAAAYISTEEVNAFALLFRGNPDKYYVRTSAAAYIAVKGAPTTTDYLRHLRGEWPSLLISPITVAGKVFFGALDVDRHSDTEPAVDLAALAIQITELNLPLVLTRSRGGRGAWLWIFFKEPEGFDAGTAIRLLDLYREVLNEDSKSKGLTEIPKGTEIFPKQVKIEEGGTGNGGNLPCWGTEREAYGPRGEPLDLRDFLKLAGERMSYGCILELRNLKDADADAEEHAVPNAVRDASQASQENALPASAIRELYLGFIQKLSDAPEGKGNIILNATSYFAGRVSASEVLDETPEKTKQALFDIIAKWQWKERGDERKARNTLEGSFSDGFQKPFKVLDPQEEHDNAYRAIDELLHDITLEVTQPLAIFASAGKLTEIEYDLWRRPLAKRLNSMSPDKLDEHVGKFKPKAEEEKDDLQGSEFVFKDIVPWPEPVDGAALLNEIRDTFARYVYFSKDTDAAALALWTLGTHAFAAFDIYPRLGVTSREEDSGKTTVLKLILRLARWPMPGSNTTAAVIFVKEKLP